MPDGAVGEICIRSASVMSATGKGWSSPPRPSQAAGCTGDVGIRDSAGSHHILDWKQDMIIAGGFSIYPKPVEDVLTTYEAAAAAAVVGIPAPGWGGRVTAHVVARPGRGVDPDEVVGLVRAQKGPPYALKSVTLIDRLPTTPAGETDEKALRAAGQAAVGAPVEAPRGGIDA